MGDILDGDYEVDFVLAERRTKRGRSLLIRWKNYGHRGDTWEPQDHVEPKRKVAAFDRGVQVNVDLRFGLHVLHEAFARQLTSTKAKDRGAMRKHIGRVRDAIPERYKEATGLRLRDDEVLQNVPGQGYRLNPETVFVVVE